MRHNTTSINKSKGYVRFSYLKISPKNDRQKRKRRPKGRRLWCNSLGFILRRPAFLAECAGKFLLDARPLLLVR
ncbi:hypothetical protein FHS30_001201 [Simiduia aestuariiviva]|uniref:Uncharacterized protein n=1 Tax=Simiduia aestuariiviva TaxID=1510459 RepID=A0A839URI5_9GAMM|nr:hypothetical protein [Simiduia aestuariiviva]